MVSDLTYDLRSGSPDFVDRMVASTYAGMAMDSLQEGKTGLMTAISNGCYAMVPIPEPKLGPRKVEIAKKKLRSRRQHNWRNQAIDEMRRSIPDHGWR